MKVGFISLGCSKNQVNCEQMMWQTHAAGHELSLTAEDCDVAVINTCGFLQEACQEAMEEFGKLRALQEAGRLRHILVTGCMAQRYQEELDSRFPGAAGFVGVSGYEKIGEVLAELEAEGDHTPQRIFEDNGAPVPETNRVVIGSEYAAYLRIAEGCDNRCTYCVIPSIRGKFRSRPMEAILEEAAALAADGIREVIVIAQDITRYGLDLYGQRRLPALLRALCQVEGITWVRVHYLYPDEVTEELMEVIAGEEKIVKYIDLPIQHISDRILRAMHRRGTGAEIRTLFRRLREVIPGVVIRTSLITGFPGETEAEFEELCEFLREFRLERAGIFAYSPEPGSVAAALEDQVEPAEKRRRLELLTQLQLEVTDRCCEERVGQTVTVLCEGFDQESGRYWGRSGAESPGIDGVIYLEGDGELEPGQFYEVTITAAEDGESVGEVAGA